MVYETIGREFEPLRARHILKRLQLGHSQIAIGGTGRIAIICNLKQNGRQYVA
jgi:hypothetical protein